MPTPGSPGSPGPARVARVARVARAAIAAVAAIAVLAACEIDDFGPVTGDYQWHGVLEGRAGWEHIGGQAAFLWTERTTVVAAGIEITGDEPGKVRPWHIHHNSCAEGGGIVGSDAEYPRVVIGADGTGGTGATVAVALDPAARYHVNVHHSEAEMDVIIACADMSRL
jgi:hypothetical protein